jgi:hypothetical protein
MTNWFPNRAYYMIDAVFSLLFIDLYMA